LCKPTGLFKEQLKIKIMITELLDAAIIEVSCNHSYQLTEFQLGDEPMKIFIAECLENMGIPIERCKYSSVTSYKSIPIKLHHNKDAVMYLIAVKKLAS